MTVITVPQCYNCKHFSPDTVTKLTCKAYPQGIPDEILTGEHDHKKTFKGDNGITFEPIDKTP